METSGNVPEVKVFPPTNKSENSLQLLSPEVTVNQTFHVNPHQDRFLPTCCTDADYFCQKTSRKVGQVNQEFRSQPAGEGQHFELTEHREPEDRGASFVRMNLLRGPRPAETRQGDTRRECCCCVRGPNRCGTTEPANRDTTRGENNSQLQSDEEDLEPPLPLRSDDQCPNYRPRPPPHHYMYNYDLYHTMDVRYYHSAGQGKCNLNPINTLPPQSCHAAPCQYRRAWDDSQNCVAQGSVSVNVPQFSVPPVEALLRVNVMNQSSARAEGLVSHPHEKRRTISLPDECRNVFITHSSDISSEIVPFVDFLTKHGFRPAIDIFDNPMRRMDINKWKDSYLKHQSALIVIAISPKYKSDIEGCVVDSHDRHTKYIHSMMLNEFIQQGSLNFRFIPLLFLNASQKHIPSWLQNTRVFRWPQDAEDVLLRLLREERYVPTPVPPELTLIIRPVAPSAATTL
ncbi:uncharacterized protein LOC117936239 isoform X2 [Etheostoma cragini]|uniref:uncharacterized protein LOC117936239 isoform X2 n=1 Tax=Etheostoma cragini TaxID=417921 RepID=UPI00155E5140|nr:uncharacterized protein LOC117936239 isoform X2 [Etheostoma cragini]